MDSHTSYFWNELHAELPENRYKDGTGWFLRDNMGNMWQMHGRYFGSAIVERENLPGSRAVYLCKYMRGGKRIFLTIDGRVTTEETPWYLVGDFPTGSHLKELAKTMAQSFLAAQPCIRAYLRGKSRAKICRTCPRELSCLVNR